jgi:hypothetical protein
MPAVVKAESTALKDSESGDDDSADLRVGELLLSGHNLVQADLGRHQRIQLEPLVKIYPGMQWGYRA